jgi:hypothetical protein
MELDEFHRKVKSEAALRGISTKRIGHKGVGSLPEDFQKGRVTLQKKTTEQAPCIYAAKPGGSSITPGEEPSGRAQNPRRNLSQSPF